MILKRLRIYLAAWSAFARSQMRSTYRFTTTDCRLHVRERLWQTPPVDIREETEDYYRLAIQNRDLYCPKALNSSGLGWLYNEVFGPWPANPASYAHPRTPVPTDGWVVDAGACEGFFSMFALEQGAGRVIAIEPVSELSVALALTFAQAQTEGRLEVISSALADKPGTLYLHAEADRVWDSTVLRGHSNVDTVYVQTITIDELVTKRGLADNGFIKMDIEGAEMAALQGAVLTLRKYKPHLAIAVYHSYENAIRCREIILSANPRYHVEFRGMYAWVSPSRPYLLFAW